MKNTHKDPWCESLKKSMLLTLNHSGCNRMTSNCTLLARANFTRLLAHDWRGLQWWTRAGWSVAGAAYSSKQMQPLGVPSWETTLRWSAELQKWYVLLTATDC